jgi:hypothetical protein
VSHGIPGRISSPMGEVEGPGSKGRLGWIQLDLHHKPGVARLATEAGGGVPMEAGENRLEQAGDLNSRGD